jgi:hypothetical protein
MRNGEWSKLVSVAGRILLAFLFVFSQGAWAGQDPKAKDNLKPAEKAGVQQTDEKLSSATTQAKTETDEGQAESSEKSAEEKPSGDGGQGDIKVHGHWTIEVRDPDGTVVSHREFENSIQQGAQALTAILGHQAASGFWSVDLYVSPNCGNVNSPACIIAEPGPPLFIVPPNSTNLVASVTNSGASLTLAGSVQAPVAMQIANVQTVLSTCLPRFSSAACTQVGGPGAGQYAAFGFTSTNRATPDVVQAGQIVQVTVVISFS